MKLQEIFDALRFGELSQLNIGGGEAGEIAQKDYPALVSSINLGLTALHKRFTIRENTLFLDLQPGVFSYSLSKKFVARAGRMTPPVRYLREAPGADFDDDIIKIERIYTGNSRRCELSLNDLACPTALRTPSMNVLSVPADIVNKDMHLPPHLLTDSLEIVYRANHPAIAMDPDDIDLDYEAVDLPATYLESLLLFVAARAHTPTGMINEHSMGNNYAAKYETSCQKLEMFNIRVDQGSQPDRLHAKGWV